MRTMVMLLGLSRFGTWIAAGILLLALVPLIPIFLGAVLIRERQVGIVVKRFGGNGLAPGRLVALNNEAGLPGGHIGSGFALGLFSMAIPDFQSTRDGGAARRDRVGGCR